jgi:TldD protein
MAAGTTTRPEAFAGLDPHPLLRDALARGGALADLFVESVDAVSASIEGGEVRAAGRAAGRGAGLRVLTSDGRTLLASSTDLAQGTLAALARDLAELASGPPTPGARDLPGAPVDASDGDDGPAAPLEALVELASLADRAARGVDRRVAELRVHVRDRDRRFDLAASDATCVRVHTRRAVLGVEVVATDGGVTQTSHEAIGGVGGHSRLAPGEVEALARSVATRAVRMLGARPAPAGTMTVVLAAEAGGTFVHEAVGHALEADTVLEGLSVFGDRLGQRIAAPGITVVDDPTLPGMNGSFAVDDEGVPARRVVLVEDGVLRAFLLDRRAALLMGGESGGKGRRESFRHRPLVRMSNTTIAPGGHDPEALVRDTRRGLLVVRMGGGEVDTVTGQFVFEVNEAYLIERGQVGAPVRGATLLGDCATVLGSIDGVGRDLGFALGTCGKAGQDVPVTDGEPTLRIPRLVVGGSG